MSKNFKSIIINNYDYIILFTILVLFVIYKSPLLHFPYYWDEAWSYKPAIEEMYINSPSLLPNSISVEHYKGHPLFFYFSSSLWLTIFGNTIFSSKFFALFISVLVLVVSFIFTRFLTNSKLSAVFVVLLIASQSIFVAQSTLVLPEMLLALLSLLSLYLYLKKQKILFVIFTSLLLLTKETGVMLLFSIILFEIINSYKSILHNLKKTVTVNIYLLLPIIPVALYFILQKILVGWYFYPEHIGFVEFGDVFYTKLEGYLGYLFIYQSRNILSVIAIAFIIYSLIKKVKIKTKPLMLFFIFIVSYILFSSVNFYATRYMLSLIPVFTIMVVYIISSVIKKEMFKGLVYVLVLTPVLIYTFTHNKNSDHNRGYENNIIVQQKMIEYCENNDLYNNSITTHFLMLVNLTDSIMGYLSASNKFNNISTYIINNSTDYAIISSNEFNKDFDENILQSNGVEVVLFKEKQAWCKLYKFK